MDKIVVVATCPISDGHVQKMKQVLERTVRPSLYEICIYPDIKAARTRLGEAEILLTYGEDLTEEILQECRKLKWIQVLSAGLEKMPLQAIARRQIMVTNARGIHAIPMAEYAVGVMLLFAKKFLEMRENQYQSQWDRSLRFGELAEKTVGIIGTGAIGSEIANRAKCFGMQVLGVATDARERKYFDRVYANHELAEVLQVSDYVILILPLTDKTKGMIGSKELVLMKKSSVLINMARGAVVDEAALIHALDNKDIRGAAIDVFKQEPLPQDHPFWHLKNCILTPHISSRSPKYMERAQNIFLHNLAIYLGKQGKMENLIDLHRGY